MKRVALLATVLAIAVSFAVPVGAGPLGGVFQVTGERVPYVVILADDPVVAYEGDLPGLAATKPGRGAKVNPNSPAVLRYLEHLDRRRDDASAKARIDPSRIVNSFNFALVGFSALLTPAEAERLAVQKGVISVQPDELRELHTDTSGDFLGLTDGGGAYATGYTGEGVVVGVIDTGIWPEHPSFADDGSYSDPGLEIPCEFGDSAHNPEDVPFTCNNKLVGARDMRTLYNSVIGPELYNSARDPDGHGSHTAGTAAGNADVAAQIFGIDRGLITGIAHRAHVVAYKACGELGCFTGDTGRRHRSGGCRRGRCDQLLDRQRYPRSDYSGWHRLPVRRRRRRLRRHLRRKRGAGRRNHREPGGIAMAHFGRCQSP